MTDYAQARGGTVVVRGRPAKEGGAAGARQMAGRPGEHSVHAVLATTTTRQAIITTTAQQHAYSAGTSAF